MIPLANQILSSIPPDHMPLVEFFGMLTIGVTASSLGVL
tara:strand:+ start:440 stop:556 length:117 start_codon:yes stop_codon:yes gene_type:complete